MFYYITRSIISLLYLAVAVEAIKFWGGQIGDPLKSHIIDAFFELDSIEFNL